MVKKLFWIFLLAFILNWGFENAHSFLYVHYQGGSITQFVLLRAAFADAVMLTIFSAVFFRFRFLSQRPWLLLFFGVIVAVFLEWWALGTGRWAYNASMPIVPLLGTGLTPTIQLAVLGYGVFMIVSTLSKSRTKKVVKH